ncbi:MAG: methyltransferase domain-containing protein [Proteobacteria bacterium]|nr:methyltransferase domain-containing protein [Pseudomonadota bacterium]
MAGTVSDWRPRDTLIKLITRANNLACPIDGLKLDRIGKQLSCENGHSYDIARQGYVNLLPVQHKRSKQPGDSKVMVVARSEFLDSGVYQPIADKLVETVLTLLPADGETCILDAGCGEGYYFDTVFTALGELAGERASKGELSLIGLDISKDAIIQATKRNRQTSWIVGTNRQPPLLDNSVDIILCMFGFVSATGFEKVLKPGGKIVLVDPGIEHLKELREIIYPEVKKSAQSGSRTTELPGFSSLKTEKLRFTTEISDVTQINNLLLMTPHFYRASKAGREAASRLDTLAITIDVTFRVFEKT